MVLTKVDVPSFKLNRIHIGNNGPDLEKMQ